MAIKSGRTYDDESVTCFTARDIIRERWGNSAIYQGGNPTKTEPSYKVGVLEIGENGKAVKTWKGVGFCWDEALIAAGIADFPRRPAKVLKAKKVAEEPKKVASKKVAATK